MELYSQVLKVITAAELDSSRQAWQSIAAKLYQAEGSAQTAWSEKHKTPRHLCALTARIPALEKLIQEDWELKAGFNYTENTRSHVSIWAIQWDPLKEQTLRNTAHRTSLGKRQLESEYSSVDPGGLCIA